MKFTSDPKYCSVHDAGWVEILDGIEITKLPVWDTQTRMFARLGHGSAEAWAGGKGYRLPMADEYQALHKKSLFIEPFTMPTPDMLRHAGISPRDQTRIDVFRNANMMSQAWCGIHDTNVFFRLEEAGWLADTPVSNCGKHWCRGGIIFGWWRKDGTRIQNPSKFHYNEPTYVDYATTFHVCRPKASDPVRKKSGTGVDISKYQDPKNVDYKKLAEDHDFMVARASYGVKPDPTFRTHFRLAKDAGMKVGGYLFFRQQQSWEDQYEAFTSELEAVGFGSGDILPVVDLEENQRWDGKLSPIAHNTDARKIMEKLKDIYGDCYAYLSPAYYVNIGEPKWLLEYPWWIAHYTSGKEPNCKWKQWDIWQYTGKGKTPGYSGKTIDLNRVNILRMV